MSSCVGQQPPQLEQSPQAQQRLYCPPKLRRPRPPLLPATRHPPPELHPHHAAQPLPPGVAAGVHAQLAAEEGAQMWWKEQHAPMMHPAAHHAAVARAAAPLLHPTAHRGAAVPAAPMLQPAAPMLPGLAMADCLNKCSSGRLFEGQGLHPSNKIFRSLCSPDVTSLAII
eukprot:5136787-Amphidinium_carterae.1